MAERAFSDDDLRLYELLQQFLCLSDSTEVAGTLLLIGPKGSIVGDCTLSAADIQAAADALLKLNISRADAADPAAEPLPLTEDDLADTDVDDVFSSFATLLGSEDGEL